MERILILILTFLMTIFGGDFMEVDNVCVVVNFNSLLEESFKSPKQDSTKVNKSEEIEIKILPKEEVENEKRQESLKYCFHHVNSAKYKVFEAVDTVLKNLNLQEVDFNSTHFHTSNCDVLWAYQIHDLYKIIKWNKLGYFRKVNHIPGNYHLTSKSVFGRFTDSKYLPKSFTDSKKLQEFAKEFPEKQFVLKLKSNRGIKLVNVSEVDFEEDLTDLTGHFAQEFIKDPLLVDGHKFDFGIYVVVTSVRPLRLYYYTENLIMRFCSKPYSTDDPDDVEAYVIGENIHPVWKFNGTKKYVKSGYTAKDAFEGILMDYGANASDIWLKIKDAVRSIVVSKEKNFSVSLDRFNSKTFNHFELFRFDFLLDSSLNLYVIEVNQHPNIYPGPPHKPNRFVYENLLYNLFNLIGIGTSFTKSSLRLSSDVEKMIAHSQLFQVKPQVCMNEICEMSCEGACKICWKCQNVNQRYSRFEAYREQMNLGAFKRLFPVGMEGNFDFENDLTEESLEHAEWFGEMCQKNYRFC